MVTGPVRAFAGQPGRVAAVAMFMMVAKLYAQRFPLLGSERPTVATVTLLGFSAVGLLVRPPDNAIAWLPRRETRPTAGSPNRRPR